MSESHIGKPTWNKGISTDTSHLSSFQFKLGEKPNNKGTPLSIGERIKASISKKINKTITQYLGVCYNIKAHKWMAQIKFESKTYYGGLYETEIESAIAYDIIFLWISKASDVPNFPELLEKYKSLVLDFQIETIKELRSVIKKEIKNLGGSNDY